MGRECGPLDVKTARENCMQTNPPANRVQVSTPESLP
jgi:hypothetical protein